MRIPEDDYASQMIKDVNASEIDIQAEEIHFPMQKPNDDGRYHCICLVNMVGSTKITAQIGSPEKIRKYYSIFLNAVAAISKNFGATVIKNVGDALLFYFSDTSDSANGIAFNKALECCMGIIAARDLINKKLYVEGLPEVSYRISADYGQVEVGTSVASGAEDFFGPTVNMCAKMNRRAERNGIVIGSDLYRIIKQFPFEAEYEFKEIDQLSIGLKQSYPLYSAKRKGEKSVILNNSDDLISSIFKRSDKIPKKPNVHCDTVDICQTKTHRWTILLVDDEPDVLATLKTFLLEGDYNVEAFDDPYNALQAFARSKIGHFDLVILDIRMPSMNGLQLYRRLKAIDPDIKIVFLTALDATEELVSVLDGISSVDVMTKPVYSGPFLQKIRAYVGELSAAGSISTN